MFPDCISFFSACFDKVPTQEEFKARMTHRIRMELLDFANWTGLDRLRDPSSQVAKVAVVSVQSASLRKLKPLSILVFSYLNGFQNALRFKII